MFDFSRLLNEPASVAGVVNSIMVMLVLFGVPLTKEQSAAILLVVNGILALLVRALVTPNHLAEARVDRGQRPTDSTPPNSAQMAMGEAAAERKENQDPLLDDKD